MKDRELDIARRAFEAARALCDGSPGSLLFCRFDLFEDYAKTLQAGGEALSERSEEEPNLNNMRCKEFEALEQRIIARIAKAAREKIGGDYQPFYQDAAFLRFANKLERE